MMLSKNQIKFIRSLEYKKYRLRHNLFVVEGDKTVREILDSNLTVSCLLAKQEWLKALPSALKEKIPDITTVSTQELEQISWLKTPNQSMALVEIPHYPLNISVLKTGLTLYLNHVQDPGNLGTILRTADWFGIRHVLYDEGCADPYNPKTIQSTMGAFIRVKTYPVTSSIFTQITDIPIYGTFLYGENIYSATLTDKAMIVMGNESQGISDEVAHYVNQKLTIPSYPPGTSTSESLNVAIATAIICAEFRRR